MPPKTAQSHHEMCERKIHQLLVPRSPKSNSGNPSTCLLRSKLGCQMKPLQVKTCSVQSLHHYTHRPPSSRCAVSRRTSRSPRAASELLLFGDVFECSIHTLDLKWNYSVTTVHVPVNSRKILGGSYHSNIPSAFYRGMT